MRLVLSSVVLMSLVACSKPAETTADPHHGAETKAAAEVAAKPVDRETVDADGMVRRGEKLSAEAALTAAEVAAKAKELDGKTVKLTGTVDSVCQPMGCWFVIKGDTPEQNIRVSSKGHNVFMPKSSAGRAVVAEGELKVRTLSKEQAQHFEDEKELKAGETRKVFTGDVVELSLALTAVELQPAKS
jgi:hypothetical protein